ncbi:endonuclease [Hyphobacterium sp. CCMP332]|nr:endonuclease [Hyphobacterium sp. CCMP332]
MRKLFFALICFGLFTNSKAQDSAYYHTAFNSSGDTLKANLHNIIKGHTTFPYSSSSTDVWDMLKQSDKDPANPSNVILIYSGRSVDAAQEFNNGNGWNREHVWAKSRGDFGNNPPAGTDAHHLRPSDISVNADRDNRNFDDCITCIDIIDNGFNTGSKKDANLWTFEPRDAVKGDIARMIFYMAVRYEGDGNEPDLELSNTLQSQSSKQPLHAVLNTLLNWNRQDTVDAFERNRNLAIYNFQGNKNPFIDHPELAEYLWGDSLGMVWKPELVVIGLDQQNRNDFSIYPNPSSGHITINSSHDAESVRIYNQMGKVVLFRNTDIRSLHLNLNELQDGLYFIQMNFEGNIVRKRLLIVN